jgi:hypothetical protein
MNHKDIKLIPICAAVILIIISGCVTQDQKSTSTYTQNNPPKSNAPSPFDYSNYAQVVSEIGTGKTVAVILSPDKNGLIWQGGSDISTIVSWEAKLSDGTILIQGSSAPSAGQFDGFNENIVGKNLIVTAKFSDGYEQVILSTIV